MKHKLIVIGWLGSRRAYLDIPRDEAIRRYEREKKETPSDDQIDEFEFTDEFGGYDIWDTQSV